MKSLFNVFFSFLLFALTLDLYSMPVNPVDEYKTNNADSYLNQVLTDDGEYTLFSHDFIIGPNDTGHLAIIEESKQNNIEYASLKLIKKLLKGDADEMPKKGPKYEFTVERYCVHVREKGKIKSFIPAGYSCASRMVECKALPIFHEYKGKKNYSTKCLRVSKGKYTL